MKNAAIAFRAKNNALHKSNSLNYVRVLLHIITAIIQIAEVNLCRTECACDAIKAFTKYSDDSLRSIKAKRTNIARYIFQLVTQIEIFRCRKMPIYSKRKTIVNLQKVKVGLVRYD